ncbi:hypothetical protein OPQ81_008971 [Rhizoctonia solani]|nr:hypothetical protein OPQ81_008971 [Rhizoctonia solani]
MPMTIDFSEQALKTLMFPPPPSKPLRDIIRTIKISKDLNALATMGRDILSCCVRSRSYKPPIDAQFEVDVDEIISDRVLERVARQSLLLQRLKVEDEVANNPTDVAHIFCAYLGATFLCSFKEEGSNRIHDSINDLCTMVLEDDAREVTEINSHERMMNIPGVQRAQSPVMKQEPGPSYSSSTRAPSTVSQLFDNPSIESVSSGLGPVHASSPATFAQPQPQYNTPPPATIPSQTAYPTQPLGAMPPGGYPSMGMPQNLGFTQPPPVPVATPQQTQGFISLINELAMKNRKSLSWQQAKVGQQHMPEWTMWLSVDGQIRGQGTAPTKQAAKEIASKTALQSLGWIQG